MACDIDDVADFLRDTADAWNEQIEDWIYVTDTRLAREVGVSGYYVRIAPEVPGEARAELRGMVEVRNRFAGHQHVEADELISTDALALVRFGLRAADDPRIIDTVKVIDHVLHGRSAVRAGLAALQRRRLWRARRRQRRTTAPASAGSGRCSPASARTTNWRPATAPRRSGCWRRWRPAPVPASCCPSRSGTAAPIPERELEPGQPSGSAMPLVWAHAEHIKLLRSLADGAVFDRPPQTGATLPAREACRALPAVAAGLAHAEHSGWAGAAARSARAASLVHWSTDGWQTRNDVRTNDVGLGIHSVEIPTAGSGGWSYDCIYVARHRDEQMDRTGLHRHGGARVRHPVIRFPTVIAGPRPSRR